MVFLSTNGSLEASTPVRIDVHQQLGDQLCFALGHHASLPVRFRLDGKCLSLSKTPTELCLPHNSVIDICYEQYGGANDGGEQFWDNNCQACLMCMIKSRCSIAHTCWRKGLLGGMSVSEASGSEAESESDELESVDSDGISGF